MSTATTATFSFAGIGTSWQIDTEAPLPDGLRVRVLDLVERFDRTWSRFRDDSVIAGLRQPPYRIDLPPEAGALLDLYDRLARLTDGAMNPLVGENLEQFGYGPGYPLRATAEPRPALRWDRITRTSDRLSAPGPVVLDIGAAGKGLLAGLVTDLVTAAVPGRVTVDASGDLVRLGPAIRIALEHPGDATRAVGVAELTDAALCASATNRRAWGPGLHHVLDARSGRPVAEVVATWVIATDPMAADALATALFFVGPGALAAEFDFEFVRMTRRGLESSADWPGEVFG